MSRGAYLHDPLRFFFLLRLQKTSRPGVQHPPAPPPARDKHAGASARTRERDLSEKQRPFPCLLYSVSLVLPAIPSKVQPRRSRSLRRALYLVSPSFLGVQVPENQGYKRGNQLHHPPGAALSSWGALHRGLVHFCWSCMSFYRSALLKGQECSH
jgi:hypothetical protein